MFSSGIIDICHRMLFGTPGTMANVPMINNVNSVSHRLHHSIVSWFTLKHSLNFIFVQTTTDPTDPSQNLSLLQYVNSKFPHHQLNRDNPTNAASTQALQKYFTSQQNQLQPKYEVRTARNVHIFDEKLGNIVRRSKLTFVFRSFYLSFRTEFLKMVHVQVDISRHYVRLKRLYHRHKWIIVFMFKQIQCHKSQWIHWHRKHRWRWEMFS